MMEVRTVRRAAVDGWLRVARLPFDTVARLLPSDRGRRNAAVLTLDRADAAARAKLGGLFNDPELLEDAARRRIAADERERAIEYRLEAERKQRDADAQLARELNAAEDLRERAERDAQERMRKADTERARRVARTRESTAAQKRDVEQARAKRRAAEETAAKRERLEVLDQQASTLDQEADALTAEDEAQRLRDAAAAAKAARKASA
jgi:dTMP kinase